MVVRRGVRVTGLVGGPSAIPGVPHVAGVRTSAGEELRADLVVDAMGRRSRAAELLRALGAREPHTEAEDCGFAYYTRYFTGPSRPALLGPPLVSVGSISLVTIEGDNDTWSVTVFSSSATRRSRRCATPSASPAWSRRARCRPTGSTASRSRMCWPWPGSWTATAASSSTAVRS